MRSLLFAFAIAATIGGCVKSSTYDAALNENKRLQGELADAQKKQADTEKTLGDKIKELAGLRRQHDAAEKRIAAYKALQDKFRALVDTGKLQVVFRNGQMTLKLP